MSADDTRYGFEWGPSKIERTATINGTRILRIVTEHRELEIAISPTGRSVRAFLDGKKLTAQEDTV